MPSGLFTINRMMSFRPRICCGNTKSNESKASREQGHARETQPASCQQDPRPSSIHGIHSNGTADKSTSGWALWLAGANFGCFLRFGTSAD